MTKIVAEEPLPSAAFAAPAAIERAIRAVCRGDSLTVRVPARLGARTEIDLDYDVRCTVTRGPDAAHLNEVVKLVWEPADGVPLPHLRANVTADWDEPGTHAVLRLEGEYEPPGGELGQVFDAEVGKRVADASARDFLSRVVGALGGESTS
jgi:hypothetical protein